jgi:uncharacterized membrane protein YiaA
VGINAEELVLFLIGAGIVLIGSRNALVSGSSQVLFGMAAAVTFGLGRLFDTVVG